jgi:hypothetical protein
MSDVSNPLPTGDTLEDQLAGITRQRDELAKQLVIALDEIRNLREECQRIYNFLNQNASSADIPDRERPMKTPPTTKPPKAIDSKRVGDCPAASCSLHECEGRCSVTGKCRGEIGFYYTFSGAICSRLVDLEDALREMIDATTPGDKGLTAMATQEGRCAFYQRLRPIRDKAESILSKNAEVSHDAKRRCDH